MRCMEVLLIYSIKSACQTPPGPNAFRSALLTRTGMPGRVIENALSHLDDQATSKPVAMRESDVRGGA